jgi:hypothetical protein
MSTSTVEFKGHTFIKLQAPTGFNNTNAFRDVKLLTGSEYDALSAQEKLAYRPITANDLPNLEVVFDGRNKAVTTRQGEKIAEVLCLRKRGNVYPTNAGDKSASGLLLTIEHCAGGSLEKESAGDDETETARGNEIIRLLRLNVKSNGRVDTDSGDKTPLGLMRTIRHIVEQA